jgi:hypothetical protein
MPITIKVLHNGMGVLYECRGVLTGKDFFDANNQLLALGEEINKVRYRLIDEMAINDINISKLEIMTIAEQYGKIACLGPNSAVVAVIAKDAFAFGLSQLRQSFIEYTGWEIMTFRDRLMAESWIMEKVKENFGVDLTF